MSIFKRIKRAAVLGCGPAGLFAAHGLIEAGWTVDVFSNKRRSEMFGAQYLHEPIHGLVERSTVVNYSLRGTVEEYRHKVYGDQRVSTVSPESMTGQHAAWDIRAAYYDAWDQHSDRIQNQPGIDNGVAGQIVKAGYHLVISSLPAPALCVGGHQFPVQRVWAIGDAPERGVFSPIKPGKDIVVCDGTPITGWYRASNVFGYNTVEWPENRKPPIGNLAPVYKPISTNCTCLPDIVRVGRYGTWTKGVLSHEAYKTAKELA